MTIDLNRTPEQEEIVSSVRRALHDLFPVARLRGAHADGVDAAGMAALAQLGIFGLGAAEHLGGAGFTVVEEALLAAELGRFLVTPCALATLLAAQLAIAAGLEPLAESLIAARQWACLASPLAPVSTMAPAGEAHLLDAQGASFALLWNETGMALLRHAGPAGEALACTDRSVALHRVTLSEGAVLARVDAGSALMARAELLLCATLLGMAESACDMAVAYAKVRVQFGQPIGAFQAIKHRCVDMAVAVQALKAQIAFAAIAQRDAWPDAAGQVDACRYLAARAALANARENIQVHGAIGFTAECDAHLYLLRTHLYKGLGRSQTAVRQRLASPGGDPAQLD